MGTFLRVLVILLLPLTVATLVFGIMLFDRREMLKGRTQKLEDTLFRLSPVIEEKTASIDQKPEHPARDVDGVRAENIADPRKSDFWLTYKDHLELTDQPKINVRAKENDLTLFYQLADPITRERRKDPLGNYITKGPGTMQEILDDIVNKATDQLNRMEETRQQLTTIRKELEECITELNATKKNLRDRLVHIVALEQEIVTLKADIEAKKAEIASLNQRIASLEDTIKERDREIAVKNDIITDRDAEIKNLKQYIAQLERQIQNMTRGDLGTVEKIVLTAGSKGKVIGIDNEWKFVIFEPSAEFIQELTKQSRLNMDLTEINVALDVFRPADKGRQFVTRIRLTRMKDENGKQSCYGDILSNWQQQPIMLGDDVVK
jgi:cell division protein FtsB